MAKMRFADRYGYTFEVERSYNQDGWNLRLPAPEKAP